MSITQEVYNEALGPEGEERDWEGFKKFLKERKKHQKALDLDLREGDLEKDGQEKKADHNKSPSEYQYGETGLVHKGTDEINGEGEKNLSAQDLVKKAQSDDKMEFP